MKRLSGRSHTRAASRPRRTAGRKRGARAQAPVHVADPQAIAEAPTGNEPGSGSASTASPRPSVTGAQESAAPAKELEPTSTPAAQAAAFSSSSTGAQPPAPGVAPSERTSSNRVEEFLGFRLDNEEYCVWIRSIKEIIRPPEITPIPRSPADILGLISLRGTIVPIFNIRRRLGLPGGSVGPKSRIVVVVLDAGPVGMVVDHVTEVISMDPNALEPPPPTMGEREASLVTATVRVHDRIIGVLHLERLVAVDTEMPLRAVA